MNIKKLIEIEMCNDIAELGALCGELDKIGDTWNLPPDLIFNLNLVLEELLTNTIFYGYDIPGEHVILLKISLENDIIMVTITDNAKAFDPLARPDPDVTQALEERKIGGLGIYLVKKIMDDLTYTRSGDKNILTLRKKIQF